MQGFLLLFFLVFVSWSHRTHCFCAKNGLHADLTRAVVRSSDWLRQYYKDNSTMIPPYFASSMIVSLRLSGHLPDILISDFKDRNSMSIKETLKNYLDEQYIEYGNLTEIPTGRLAYIVQAVIAICENPNNFYGYNLYNPLRFGIERFGASPTFNNYFQYSLAVIALCNGGIEVSKRTVHELIKGANGRRNIHFVDTSALILIALSCAKKSYTSYQAYRASRKLIVQIIFKQNASTGAFGNQYSTALAVEALVAAGVKTKYWYCEKAMRNILSYQDDKGSFGNALANIQITPSLLGESAIYLKNLACPSTPKNESAEIIIVFVGIRINDTKNPVRNVPPVIVRVLEGTTAFEILEQAAVQNPCYKAEYRIFPGLGRSITTLCGVKQDPAAGLYWLIYENGRPAQFGVDQLKPKQGARLTFRYQKV